MATRYRRLQPVFFSLPGDEKKKTGKTSFVPADTLGDITQKIKEILSPLSKELDKIEQSGKLQHQLVKKIFGGFFAQVRAFIAEALGSLDELAKVLELLAGMRIELVNAFLCGVVNGFLDAVAGLVQLIKWIFDVKNGFLDILKDIKGQLPTVLEQVDAIMQGLAQFSFRNLFAAIGKGIRSLLRAAGDAIDESVTEAGACKLAYFAGNVVGFIVEFIVEIIFTEGIGVVTKFFETLGAKGGRALEAVINLFRTDLRITVQKIGKKALDALALIGRFLRAGKEQVQKFIAHLFEEIKAALGIGLRAETEEFLKK